MPYTPIETTARLGNMACTVKVSKNTGLILVQTYASIKRQSGTYHHHYWFTIADRNGNDLWIVPYKLSVTIGAAVTPWNRPSRVTQTDWHDFQVDPAQIANAYEALIFMQQTRGGGSLIDQIEEADKVYRRLKELEIVKDFQKIVAFGEAAGAFAQLGLTESGTPLPGTDTTPDGPIRDQHPQDQL